MNEHNYYRSAQTHGEKTVLVVTVLLMFGALFFAFDQEFSVTGVLQYVIAVVVVLAASLLLIRLLQHQFLGNMLLVEQGRFAPVKRLAGQIAERLHMTEPQVFVTQNPVLNAYSIGFKEPYSVVFHSAVLEHLEDEEMAALLAHEIGHIWFGHTKVQAYISPLGTRIPGLSWVFGFWSRRSELTCDRLALLLTRNPRAVIDMLIKVHIGPQFLKELDAEGVLFQDHQVKGSTGKLAQSLSDHPFMTTRIKELLVFGSQMRLEYVDKQGRHVCMNCGQKIEAHSSETACPRCGMQLKFVQGFDDDAPREQPPEPPAGNPQPPTNPPSGVTSVPQSSRPLSSAQPPQPSRLAPQPGATHPPTNRPAGRPPVKRRIVQG